MASAKFLALLGSPAANRIWLVEAQAYIPASASVQSFYFCDPGAGQPFVTEPGDTPANTIYEPRIADGGGFRYTLSLYRPDGGLGGRSLPGLGEISLINTDGGLDALKDYAWDGRPLAIKLGGDGFLYSEFETIFSGTVQAVPPGTQSLVLKIRDLQFILDKPVQSAVFAGTGGVEGGPDAKDQPKPVSLGPVRNVQPRYLGQIPVGAAMMPAWVPHDGAVQAYAAASNALYDRGVPLTYEAADPPSAGKWTLRAGAPAIFIFNGSPSSQQITADLRGDATGSYVDTLGGVVRRLVTRYGGLTDPGQIDTAAFTAIDTDQPGVVGFFCRGTENLLDVLDQLCSPLGVYYGFDLQGKFTIGQVKAPAGAPALELTENQILDLDHLPTELPIWRETIGGRRNWTVQTDSDLTGAFTNSVVNGTFAVDANWTKGTGWTISGSAAQAAAGSASNLDQAQAGLIAGQGYALTFDLTRSAGSLTVQIDGADVGAAISTTATGIRRDFIAGSSTPTITFRKDASFAGTVDNVSSVPTRLEFVSQEFRAAKVENAAIKTTFLLAGENRQDTCLDDMATLQTEAQRQFDLHSVLRHAYRVRAKIDPLGVKLHDVVRMTDARFGLGAGVDFRVVVIAADLAAQEVTLTLWG